MVLYKDTEHVVPIVVVWLTECDIVFAVHIRDVETAIAEGKKSISIQDVTSGKYNIITIPSTKRRTFLDSDYTIIPQYYK